MKRETVDILGKILGIIAWGLIAFALLVGLLKWLGLIGSPPLTDILLVGILAELLRAETKFREELSGVKTKLDLLWSDFRKRKEI